MIYNNSQFNIYKDPKDFLLINDIRKDQISTIGELHYDTVGQSIKTVFIAEENDKFVRNEFLNTKNRINYNLSYTPSTFTATFDYKARGGDGADGGYFYFYAKGTQNPNTGELCQIEDREQDQISYYRCDSFPNGKYSNSPDFDAYRIHFDEYVYNQQLAISWGGYQGENVDEENIISTIGTVEDYPAGFDFGDGTWRNIKINFDKGFFRISVDGNILIESTDSLYSSRDLSGNNFGLGGYVGGLNNYHYFKNFKFYNLIF